MGAQRPFLLREQMTTTYTRERTLQDEIAPAVEARVPAVEVLAVELLSPSRFCVYIDHPDGVDHALCERVTRVLDPYRSDYTLDVSTPGSERPLRKPEHFADALGARVSVRTAEKVDGRNRFRGTLAEAGDDTLTLDAGDAGEIRIPYESIVRANLIDEGLTT
jgi:ribosome maturation factor RimP